MNMKRLFLLLCLLASPALAQNVGVRPLDDDTVYGASTKWYMNQGATGNPLMDGTAGPGSSKRWSRADHVHPTDTTRAPLDSPLFTGSARAPTVATGTNTTAIATASFVNASIAAGGFATTSALTTGLAGKAASGANSDITSLSGLSTALSVAQGGTGANSAAGARVNLQAATITVTANTTITATASGTQYLANPSAAISLTLPNAPPNGFWIALKNTTSAYSVVLIPQGTATIDEALIPAKQDVIITYNGTNWIVSGIRDRVLLSSQRLSAVVNTSITIPQDYTSLEIEYINGAVSTAASYTWARYSSDGGSSYVQSYSTSGILSSASGTTTAGSYVATDTVMNITDSQSTGNDASNYICRFFAGRNAGTNPTSAPNMTCTGMTSQNTRGFGVSTIVGRSNSYGRATNLVIQTNSGTFSADIRVWAIR